MIESAAMSNDEERLWDAAVREEERQVEYLSNKNETLQAKTALRRFEDILIRRNPARAVDAHTAPAPTQSRPRGSTGQPLGLPPLGGVGWRGSPDGLQGRLRDSNLVLPHSPCC